MKKILCLLGTGLLGAGAWLLSTIVEPTVKTATAEVVKVLVSQLGTGGSTGESTGGSTGGSTGESTGGSTGDSTGGSTGESTGGSTGEITEEYNAEEVIKNFDLANKYTIQVGEFSKQNGAYNRLNEVKSIYPSAYIKEFTKQIGDKYHTYYKVIIEEGESLGALEIYEKSIEYHENLLNIISDKVGVDEKLAFPIIENNTLQSALDNIEKYVHDKNFDKAKELIISVVEIIDAYTTNDYNGYRIYGDKIKKILDREENKTLRLGVADIYNNL